LRRQDKDPPPNLIVYADPIELARQFGRANPGMMVGLAFLPRIGLDGVQAVGLSMISATDQYDGLNHFHVLLANPRSGVLSMLAFDTGDQKPQAWVPTETETYMTGHWKVQAFYERLASIVDRFQGEGAFTRLVGSRVNERLGIDIKTDVVDNLSGRFSLAIAYEEPYRLQSRQQVFALEVTDEKIAETTLRTILGRYPGLFETKQIGPISYHAIVIPGLDEMPEDRRPPIQPFVALMDRNLFIGTSHKIFEQMVMARQGETPRLVESQDYQDLAESLSKETISMRPAGLMINRPELSWKFWYEMLKSEETRATIEQAAADNPMIERFAAILREGSLPPFDVLKKYLGPAGGVLYDTDNGIHGITFGLRRE
jgi:hypothetical protein